MPRWEYEASTAQALGYTSILHEDRRQCYVNDGNDNSHGKLELSAYQASTLI